MLGPVGPAARVRRNAWLNQTLPDVGMRLRGKTGGGGGAQELERDLAAVRKLHKKASEGFVKLLAYFGDNAGALSSEEDFWGALSPFVQELSACEREAAAQVSPSLSPSPLLAALLPTPCTRSAGSKPE